MIKLFRLAIVIIPLIRQLMKLRRQWQASQGSR